MKRITRCALALLLLSGPAAAQEPEPDRHTARREWLARRRAGELATEQKPGPGRQDGRVGAAPHADVAAELAPVPAPHRFADRYRPNHELPEETGAGWPLRFAPQGRLGGDHLPFGYGFHDAGKRRFGFGYGPPGAPGHWFDHSAYGGPGVWWLASYTCARVTLSIVPGGRYTLYLGLPPAAPYDAAELELLLDAELSAGRPLRLQSADGSWVRVQPGARLESIQVSGCGH